MKFKLLALSGLIALGGCQSMVITESADGVKVKTPTSLLAVQEATRQVGNCRVAVLESQRSAMSKIDGSSEAGRMQILMMTMVQKDQLAECDKVVSEVAAQFNATDRSRLSVIGKGVSVGGAVVGGYIVGEALAGVAAAGGTRINATNSNVTAVNGMRVNTGGGTAGGGDMVAGSDVVNVGSQNSTTAYDTNFISGDKSVGATLPTNSAVGNRDVENIENPTNSAVGGRDAELMLEPQTELQ